MATIIKAAGGTADTDAVRPIAFNFDDVVGKASAYLEQVRQQAGQILADARREAEAIKKQAQQQGQAAADAEARKRLQAEVKQQLDQQLQTVRPAMESAAGQIAAAKLACTRQWEQNMIHLAVAIAGRLIRREVQLHHEISLPVIREALELAVGSQRICLRMNPQDVQALGTSVEQMIKQIDQIGKASIAADPGIELGGCVVDTEFGTIDQQWETQLLRIEQELN